MCKGSVNREGSAVNLKELKSSALFQLLEHGSQVAPAASSLLDVSLILLPPKQRSRGVCKVGLEWEELLHPGGTHTSVKRLNKSIADKQSPQQDR